MKQYLVVLALIGSALSSRATAQTGPYSFYAVTPCRAVDTRVGYGGALTQDAVRNFTMQGVCGVPTGAKAVSVNVTVTLPTETGYLTLWPVGGARPVVSTINFVAGEPAIANGAIVPVAASVPDLSVVYGIGRLVSASTHVIIDVTGYFQ